MKHVFIVGSMMLILLISWSFGTWKNSELSPPHPTSYFCIFFLHISLKNIKFKLKSKAEHETYFYCRIRDANSSYFLRLWDLEKFQALPRLYISSISQVPHIASYFPHVSSLSDRQGRGRGMYSRISNSGLGAQKFSQIWHHRREWGRCTPGEKGGGAPWDMKHVKIPNTSHGINMEFVIPSLEIYPPSPPRFGPEFG